MNRYQVAAAVLMLLALCFALPAFFSLGKSWPISRTSLPTAAQARETAQMAHVLAAPGQLPDAAADPFHPRAGGRPKSGALPLPPPPPVTLPAPPPLPMVSP